jgi:hypothetical protein
MASGVIVTTFCVKDIAERSDAAVDGNEARYRFCSPLSGSSI